MRAARLPARVRRLRAAALGGCLAAAALALAGCGAATNAANNSAATISGSTLSIWASDPPGAQTQVDADVLDAEKLALGQAGAKVGSYTIAFRTVHDYELSASARAAVQDKTAVAYLGEIAPGTSGVSVQITNQLGLLQVSPTDTAVYLTQHTPAVPGSPGHWYPSSSTFHRTFARVVPNTAAEARATVAEVHRLGLSRLYVADDGSDYGASIAQEVRSDAPGQGVTVVSSAAGADAAFYGALPGAAATRGLDGAAAAAPSAKLFAPSALYDNAFVTGLSAAAQKRLHVSTPGFTSGGLPAAGRQFQTAFTSAYGHAPQPQAIFGYAAMKAVLAVLTEAGKHANSRSLVVADFLAIKNRQSALGTYSISGGDTTIAPFVFARPSGGRLAPRTQG